MRIRQPDSNDVPSLAALARKTYAAAFGDSFTESDLAAHLQVRLSDTYFRGAIEEDVFFVAESGASLVGFVQFGDLRADGFPTEPGDQELRRIYVLADLHNKGIGTRLLHAALAHPRMAGASRVYLDVWERNDAARRLYERYGFEVVGSRPLVTASGIASDADLVMVRSRPTDTKRPC
jgi:ribosomal protein S18 acetylase RimI-like enzyme